MRNQLALALTLFAVVHAPRLAAADDIPPEYVVGNYVGFLETVKRDVTSNDDAKTPETCIAAVAAARKAGAKELTHSYFDKLGGTPDKDGKYTIPLDRADKLCADYAQYYAIGSRSDVFEHAVFVMGNLNPDTAPSLEYAQGVVGEVAKCNKAVDAIVAAGVPPAMAFTLRDKSYTVADLKPKFCDALAKAAAKYTKMVEDAAKAERARYAKAGISGDKLDLMLKWGPDGLILAGGKSSSDLKVFAAATLIFSYRTSDPDAQNNVIHTVDRYEYKGNKLVKMTSKEYRKPAGAAVTPNMFK
jgi:hypothetical protein